MRDRGECTVYGHSLWFLQFLGAWAGNWAADSKVCTVCKLSFCSESSSDGCSIVSQCCIPGSSERQHVYRKPNATTLQLTWLTTLQAASKIGMGATA